MGAPRRVLAMSGKSHQQVLRELGAWASDLDALARTYSRAERSMITTFIRALAARQREQSRPPVPPS